MAITLCLPPALRRRIKAIGDQVEQRTCNLLREDIDLASGRIKRPLQGYIAAFLLGSRPVSVSAACMPAFGDNSGFIEVFSISMKIDNPFLSCLCTSLNVQRISPMATN